MSGDFTWPIGNNLLIDLIAPLDELDPSAKVVMDSATTITGHALSKRAKSVATAVEAAAAVTITLESVVNFAVGDEILIEETDGTFTRHPITVIDTATKIVTFTTGLTVGSGIEARVWKTYGSAVITGVSYGTAAVAETNWGYVFDFPYDYDSELTRGLQLEIMAVLHKTSTGAHYTRTWNVIMSESYGNP